MSDFIGNLLSGLSTPSGGASLLGAGISALGNVGGALLKSNADSNAMSTLQGAANQGEGFIDTGVNNYAGTIAPLMTQQPITLPTYRGLTTQQQLGESDLQRQNQSALAASGLRGAGRAGISSLEDSNSRFEAGARAGNDATALAAQQQAAQVQNAARSGLANVQAAAGTAKANTAIGAGSNIANLQAGQGTALANGFTGAAGNFAPAVGTITAAGAAANAPPPGATANTGAATPANTYGSDPNAGSLALPLGSLGAVPAPAGGSGGHI